MKVLHIIDNIGFGGAQKLLVNFAKLASDKEIQTTILCLANYEDAPNLEEQIYQHGVNIVYFTSKRLLDIQRIGNIIKYLRTQNFDIIQSHLTYANVIGPICAKFAHIPIVATLHNSEEDPRHFHLFRYWLETKLLQHFVEGIIAVGNLVEQAHHERFKHQKITVIPNAVLPFDSMEADVRKQFRMKLLGNSSNPLLISVGRFSPQKNFHLLVEAFRKVQNIHPAAKLAIIGHGAQFEDIKKQVLEYGLDPSVILTGVREDVSELLNIADIYVCSSLWEGLPLSVLEAMMAGLPIVATSVGELPKIITADIGHLVPPGNCDELAKSLIDMLDQPDNWQQYGKNAQQYAHDHYGPEAWFSKLISTYDGYR
jgi:glycosyltransferase involved in cell wall biosynthesis